MRTIMIIPMMVTIFLFGGCHDGPGGGPFGRRYIGIYEAPCNKGDETQSRVRTKAVAAKIARDMDCDLDPLTDDTPAGFTLVMRPKTEEERRNGSRILVGWVAALSQCVVGVYKDGTEETEWIRRARQVIEAALKENGFSKGWFTLQHWSWGP